MLFRAGVNSVISEVGHHYIPIGLSNRALTKRCSGARKETHIDPESSVNVPCLEKKTITQITIAMVTPRVRIGLAIQQVVDTDQIGLWKRQ